MELHLPGESLFFAATEHQFLEGESSLSYLAMALLLIPNYLWNFVVWQTQNVLQYLHD